MYKIAICDDEQACLDMIESTIKNYCKEKGFEATCQSFNDSDALMEMVEEHKLFDAYFLDVDMPCYSGLELVKKIKNLTKLPLIVLLTGYEKYAVEACGMDIFRYVLKTKWNTEARILLDELFVRMRQIKDDKIYLISNQRKYVRFMHRDIFYIMKNQKNSVFVLREGKKETERITLQQVYQKLNNPIMYFLDRSIIINIHHIRRIEGDSILMEDGYEIYEGDDNMKQLKQYLLTYWGNLT